MVMNFLPIEKRRICSRLLNTRHKVPNIRNEHYLTLTEANGNNRNGMLWIGKTL